jgi:hypothetical protein
MNLKGVNITALGEALQVAGELQEMLEKLGPTITTMIPAYRDTIEMAVSKVILPVVDELNKLAASEEAKSVIEGLITLTATTKKTAAEARLKKPYRVTVDLVSKVKALNAKSQYDAFTSAGFTAVQASLLLQQTIIADAIRDAKSSPSVGSLGSKKK